MIVSLQTACICDMADDQKDLEYYSITPVLNCFLTVGSLSTTAHTASRQMISMKKTA